jgi:hypothetical protein
MIETASQAVHRSRLDVLGGVVSVVCAIHCAVLPVLISVLPFPLLAGVLSFVPAVLRPGSGFDLVALPAAVVLAVASFSWGFSLHRRGYIFALPFAAVSLIGSGWLWAPPRLPDFFVVTGALVLAAGHILNRRLCRFCRFCRVHEVKVADAPAVLSSALSTRGDSL